MKNVLEGCLAFLSIVMKTGMLQTYPTYVESRPRDSASLLKRLGNSARSASSVSQVASASKCLLHWTQQILTAELRVLRVTVSRIFTGTSWYLRSSCRSIVSGATCSSGTRRHFLSWDTWNTSCTSDISAGN